jgi:hypothetical protein
MGRYIGKPSQLADVFRQGVAWALTSTKVEEDMDTRQKNFKQFEGKTIKSVNAEAINSVVFTTTDGEEITLNADYLHHGIPVIQCEVKN